MINAGKACAAYHDEHVRGLTTKRVQVDEIWSFTYAKAKNVAKAKAAPANAGDTVVHKSHSVVAIAATDQPRDHQLVVGVDPTTRQDRRLLPARAAHLQRCQERDTQGGYWGLAQDLTTPAK